MNSIYIYVMVFFLPISLLSQELNIKLGNDSFFLKGYFFEKDVVLKNDTSIILKSGIYNFYNDSQCIRERVLLLLIFSLLI